MQLRLHPYNHKAAFSLLEMIVAMAVLVVVIVFVAQLMSSAMVIANTGTKKPDADKQARAIFDRMAADFGGMIRRQDVDYIFAKQNGNDTMYFYSQASAYFDSSISDAAKSPVSLVGYRVNANYQLERLSQGLTWDGAFASATVPGSIVFLTPAGSSTPRSGSTIAGNWASVVGTGPSYSNGAAATYHVYGDQVYRLEFCFLTSTTGTLTNTVTSYNGLQGIAGIVVALGMLDTTSRVLVQQNAQIPSPVGIQMVAALPDAVDGTSILQTWKASNYLTTSGLPPPAAAQLRIYERTFYLSNQ